MRKILFLMLLLLPFIASAQIYKGTQFVSTGPTNYFAGRQRWNGGTNTIRAGTGNAEWIFEREGSNTNVISSGSHLRFYLGLNAYTSGAAQFNFINNGDINWSGIATGDGSGLTDLNASELTGEISLANLGSNAATAGNLLVATSATRGKWTQSVTNAIFVGAVGSGAGFTNIPLANLVSPTNGWGSQVIDFSVPEATTNMAAGITITGCAGFNTAGTNYDTAVRYLMASGANRPLIVGVDWFVNGVPGGGTVYATNGNLTKIIVTRQLGYFTNLAKFP